MSLTRLFHTVIATGVVPVTLSVYRDSGSGGAGGLWGAAAVAAASGTSTEIEATGAPKLRWERSGTAYGLTVYASFLEIDLYDPGLIRETFRGTFSETDFLAVLSAPSHTSPAGTVCPAFTWFGLPMRGESVPTIAPAVYPTGATTLRLYDGLGALSDRPGAPMTGALLVRALCEPVCRINRHLPLALALDAFPPEGIDGGGAGPDGPYTQRDPRNLRFAGELTDDGQAQQRGDFGRERDQADRALEGMGLVLYQQTTPGAVAEDAGGPAWRIAPRFALGNAVRNGFHMSGFTYGTDGDGRYSSDYTVSEVSLSPDAVTLSAEDLDLGTVPEVPGAGTIRLTETGDANLLRTIRPLVPVTEPVSELLISVTPTPGVFVSLTFRAATIDEVGVRIRLVGQGGTTYYLSGSTNPGFVWRTFPQTFDVGLSGVSFTSPEPFPESGDLYCDVLDAGIFPEAEVLLVDANGDAVTDWVVTEPGEGDGITVTLRRPPAIEVLPNEPSPSWQAPASWASFFYRDGVRPRTFTTLGSYLAYDRLQQQGRPLAAPSCTVFGLHGPGRLLRFPAANLYRSGALIEIAGVPCVVGGGLVLDLATVQTEGDWTELTTSGATGGAE